MRRLAPGQITRVMIGGPHLPQPQVLTEVDDVLLEAPNWTGDGRLLLNGDGVLFALALGSEGEPRGGVPVRIPFEGLPEINNDHVLHPDGTRVLMSAQDGQIYSGRIDADQLGGGPVQCLTSGPGGHYLHGISPDGRTMAYVDLGPEGSAHLMLQDLETGEVRELPVGEGHLDGPEFTPDGAAIVLNTEAFTEVPGHAQLARIDLATPPDLGAPPDPGASPVNERLSRLSRSESVDWFPHVSPDGRWACYLAYPPGTVGHPADLPVEVRVVSTDDWESPVVRYPVFGGQGTLNVPSWAPDSQRFAFVAYPNRGVCSRNGLSSTIAGRHGADSSALRGQRHGRPGRGDATVDGGSWPSDL